MNDLQVLSGSALIGAVAGMRSMSAPAVLAQLAKTGSLAHVTGKMSVVRHASFGIAAPILAVGEMIADKLPFTPNRTSLGPLLGRALIGGFSGAVVCSAKRRSAVVGAFIGAIAAVSMAYGAFQLRKKAGSMSHLPDPVIALAEDAIVATLGASLASRLSAVNKPA